MSALTFIGDIFIPHPYIALLPAIIFGAHYLKGMDRWALWATVVWLLYAVYETLNLLRITCSGECNIRVDLLLVYPVLIVMSIIAGWRAIRR